MRSLVTAKKMAPRCEKRDLMLSKTKEFSPSPVHHRKDIFFEKWHITNVWYVCIFRNTYIIIQYMIYHYMMPSETIWCVFSCIYRNGTFGAIAILRHQNPSRHGCLHHRPSPRQASDFAGAIEIYWKKRVPMGPMRFFPFHCRKKWRDDGTFFLKSEKIWKVLQFFSKKTHGFLRLFHIHEATTVKPWKNDFKVHCFQCWRVGGLKPNRERPFKLLYILY